MCSSLSIAAAVLALCNVASATTTRQFYSRDSGKTIALDLWQDPDHSLYLANIYVGTPPQQVTVQVDTGSSDFWVFAKDNECQVKDNGCLGGTFDPTQSSSFTNIGTGLFNASYLDNSASVGDYITETLQIGDSQVKNMTMGLIHSASSDTNLYGILGIGFPLDEMVWGTSEAEVSYYNLPYWLTAQGLINEPVYSLYLNDIDSKTSTLLFGGIDTGKFDGQLTILDVVGLAPSKNNDTYLIYFYVPLTAVGAVNSKGQTTSFNNSQGVVNAFLDSGTSGCYLPADIVRDMYQQLGIINEDGYIPCTYANSDIIIAFQLGGDDGALIGIPMAEMILPTVKDGICELGIYESPDDFFILGDTFQRAAYVVYDPGHAQIGIAQAKLNTGDSNVEAIGALASVPASIGTLPATMVGQGTGYGGTPLPGKTASYSDNPYATGYFVPFNMSSTASFNAANTGPDASVSIGTVLPTNLSGGTSIPGIATVAQTHAHVSAATNSVKSAATGLAPPSLASVLAVIGGSAVVMMAGLGGAAVIFTNL